MKNSKRRKNIFADKASLILRKMLQAPDKKWVVRDFVYENEISLGLTQEVLEELSRQGFVERVKEGPKSFTLLTNRKELINTWQRNYRFEFNEIDLYYSPGKNILKKIKSILKKEKYALTLHSGANLITSYVKTDNIYFYFFTNNWDQDILNLRQDLDLKELVSGGNIFIINPYYKNSILFNSQMIKGFHVVSNLQLYLDLYNFQPRGREHAQYLDNVLKNEGKSID
ncbi:MAG: type IV toxin-antitoxin system AbiEi family antitoxin [Elusimicrobiota bacterium]